MTTVDATDTDTDTASGGWLDSNLAGIGEKELMPADRSAPYPQPIESWRLGPVEAYAIDVRNLTGRVGAVNSSMASAF